MKRTALWWILCGMLSALAATLIVTVHMAVGGEYAALSEIPGTSGIDYFGYGWRYAFYYLLPAALVHLSGIVCAIAGAVRTDSRPVRVIFSVWAGAFFVTVPLVVLSPA